MGVEPKHFLALEWCTAQLLLRLLLQDPTLKKGYSKDNNSKYYLLWGSKAMGYTECKITLENEEWKFGGKIDHKTQNICEPLSNDMRGREYQNEFAAKFYAKSLKPSTVKSDRK